MNSALVPAVIAMSGGSAMIVSIYLFEYRREQIMRSGRVRLAVRFPAQIDPVHLKVALGSLASLSDRFEWVSEVSADGDGIRHALLVPADIQASVIATLSSAMPGLHVTEATEAAEGRSTLAAKLFIPTPAVFATEHAAAAVRTLCAGVANLAPGERAVIRWSARPGRPRPFHPKEPADRAARDTERAWRQKTGGGSGFQLTGLILVRAGSVSRAREIMEHLTSSLRSRRGSVGSLHITTERTGRSLAAVPATTRTSGWVTPSEALGLLAWPLGEAIHGMEVGGSRTLLVPKHVPREGKRLFVGRDTTGNERPVALNDEAATVHLGLLGKTGSGKSTVLARIVLDALARGQGGILIDPKDLVPELLDRIPEEYADRVVVIEPSASLLPGIDLFGGGDPILRSDVILSVIKGISDGWGPRIRRFLALGLRSLAALPEPVLYDWIRLYSDRQLRSQAIARAADPVITAEWRAYEELSAAEQVQFVAPALGRITDLLSRPKLRALLSQPDPRLNIERLLDERKWLLVSLSPGVWGEPAAHLLGAVITYLGWAAVERRVGLPPEQRRQVVFVFDELQSLASLPVGLEVFFERTRSLNCSVVAANQSLSGLLDSTRNSLLANVGSLLTFTAGADEAARVSRETAPLTAADLMGLRRYEIAGRVATGSLGSGSVVLTGRTEPLPPPTGQAEVIRRLSAERYGRDPREVDEALRRRSEGDPGGSSERYGRTGRTL